MGPRSQHGDQPGRRDDTQARFLSIRNPHRRSASPHAAVSGGLPNARIMTAWLISLVGTWGLLAIFVTMTAESAGLPISSEIVVPLGGALAAQGKLGFAGGWTSLVVVVLVCSVANLAGSLVALY